MPAKSPSPLTLDLQWLRKHPETNFRLRRPVEGECQELLDKTLKRAGEELAEKGGMMPEIEGLSWCICVIRVGPDTLMRMLCLRDPEKLELDKDTANGSGITVVMANRVVLDRVRI